MEQSKLNLDEIIENTNRKYGINLKDILSAYDIGYKKLYISMFLLAEEIRNAFFEIFPEKSLKFTFDIYGFAEALDVKVVDTDLTLQQDGIYNEESLVSFYGRYNGKRYIYMNQTISSLRSRFILALTLSCFIINYTRGIDTGTYSIYVNTPFFSDGMNMLPSSILATFILMSMRDFLEVFHLHTIQEMQIVNGKANLYTLYAELYERFYIIGPHAPIFFYRMQNLIMILHDYNGELGVNLSEFCEQIEEFVDLFKEAGYDLFKLSDNPNRNKFNN